MELTYQAQGDYLLPNLTIPEAPEVGVYGLRRLNFLKQHKKGLYTAMLLTGKLNVHLKEIDREATAMMSRLTQQMAQSQGVTEELKAQNQMRWVGLMNSIRASAEEIVMAELLYK